MNNFLAYLLANFVTVISAIFVYWLYNHYRNSRQPNSTVEHSLKLLSNEFQANRERVDQFIKNLEDSDSDLRKQLPMRFTRGAWNTLKSDGFVPHLKDTDMALTLLRTNEAIYNANRRLTSVEKSIIKENQVDPDLIYIAITECKRLRDSLDTALKLLSESDSRSR